MSLAKYIINVKEGVIETVIDKNKTIYIDQNNNFSITRIQNNDITNCEYNVFFKRND